MIRITIQTENAAFDPDPKNEVARILRTLADHIAEYHTLAPGSDIKLQDRNGNTVGALHVTK
jgi:hypothetical protein